jgi:hypothetical protein
LGTVRWYPYSIYMRGNSELISHFGHTWTLFVNMGPLVFTGHVCFSSLDHLD